MTIWPKIHENIIELTKDLGSYNALAPFMNWADDIRTFIALLILLPAKPGKSLKGKQSVDNIEGSIESFLVFKEEVSIY